MVLYENVKFGIKLRLFRYSPPKTGSFSEINAILAEKPVVNQMSGMPSDLHSLRISSGQMEA